MTIIDDMPGAAWIEQKWFREIDGEVHLIGGCCRTCGKYSFPLKPICPQCASDEQQEVPLSRTGELHTFAVSIMGPKDMGKPFVIGFIDLPEKIKLYSLIVTDLPADEHLSVGMKMEMIMDKIKHDSEGKDVVGYKFRPVSTGGLI